MLIRVEQGKGRKDRHAMLSPQLLQLLRAWWREGKRCGVMLPQGWLFPGRNPVTPLTTRQLCRAVHAAAQAARINKPVTPHTLRHSFCTFVAESGIPPNEGAALTGQDLQTWWKNYVQPRRDRQSRADSVAKLTALGLGVHLEVDQRLTGG